MARRPQTPPTRTPAKIPPKTPPKTPTETSLHEAALTHLARYAATQAGLIRVLDRRVARWVSAISREARTEGQALDDDDECDTQAANLRAAVRRVVDRLVASGAVSDAAFAGARTRSLRSAGKSHRAIGAHLAAKGVGRELAAEAALEDPERELAAAVIHARKRRLGAYRTKEETPETRHREYSSFARAGFAHGIAARALAMARDDADALIAAFRSGL